MVSGKFHSRGTDEVRPLKDGHRGLEGWFYNLDLHVPPGSLRSPGLP